MKETLVKVRDYSFNNCPPTPGCKMAYFLNERSPFTDKKADKKL